MLGWGRYCGTGCAKSHWAVHKHECKLIKACLEGGPELAALKASAVASAAPQEELTADSLGQWVDLPPCPDGGPPIRPVAAQPQPKLSESQQSPVAPPTTATATPTAAATKPTKHSPFGFTFPKADSPSPTNKGGSHKPCTVRATPPLSEQGAGAAEAEATTPSTGTAGGGGGGGSSGAGGAHVVPSSPDARRSQTRSLSGKPLEPRRTTPTGNTNSPGYNTSGSSSSSSSSSSGSVGGGGIGMHVITVSPRGAASFANNQLPPLSFLTCPAAAMANTRATIELKKEREKAALTQSVSGSLLAHAKRVHAEEVRQEARQADPEDVRAAREAQMFAAAMKVEDAIAAAQQAAEGHALRAAADELRSSAVVKGEEASAEVVKVEEAIAAAKQAVELAQAVRAAGELSASKEEEAAAKAVAQAAAKAAEDAAGTAALALKAAKQAKEEAAAAVKEAAQAEEEAAAAATAQAEAAAAKGKEAAAKAAATAEAEATEARAAAGEKEAEMVAAAVKGAAEASEVLAAEEKDSSQSAAKPTKEVMAAAVMETVLRSQVLADARLRFSGGSADKMGRLLASMMNSLTGTMATMQTDDLQVRKKAIVSERPS